MGRAEMWREERKTPQSSAIGFPVIRALWEAGMQPQTSAHNEY